VRDGDGDGNDKGDARELRSVPRPVGEVAVGVAYWTISTRRCCFAASGRWMRRAVGV
jgi:hypothetical protein